MEPICLELQQTKSAFPVTVAYMEGYDHMAYCWNFLEDKMKETEWGSSLYDQCQKCYSSKDNDRILKDLNGANPRVRLILATTSLGIGLNALAIERVINFRPPFTLETYMQESGRAGRRGQPAVAVLHYKDDLKSKKMAKEMREYCQSNSCFISFLVTHFGFDCVFFAGPPSTCCSVCESKTEVAKQVASGFDRPFCKFTCTFLCLPC